MKLEFNINQIVFTIINDVVKEATILDVLVNSKGAFYSVKVHGYTDFTKRENALGKTKEELKNKLFNL